uniref:Uncharacterized protein n=1 Tax=Rhizophora mucronata TaxID=61149 RepID=A0A2P2QAF0_RHIMU
MISTRKSNYCSLKYNYTKKEKLTKGI